MRVKPRPRGSHPLSLGPAALAAQDPESAVTLALLEAQPARRAALLARLTATWSRTQPHALARAIPQLADADRTAALAALFSSATATPGLVEALFSNLCTADPAHARDYGYAAVRALGEAAQPAGAVTLATGGPIAYAADWTNAAYYQWARIQPAEAVVSALSVGPPHLREVALESAVSGWARSDPPGMAEAAREFPAGQERTEALRKALHAWANADPEAAGAWASARPDTLDAARLALRRD